MVAALLMVLVVFQVAANQASAVTAVMQEPSSGVPTAVGSDDSALMNAANANNLTSAPPFYGDIPGGSSQCFGSDETHHFIVSDFQAPSEIPQMSRTQNGLVFSTLWGTYYVSDSHPESLSLLSSDGAVLVKESYFSLKSPKDSAVPKNGHVVSADSDSLKVRYDLVSSASVFMVVATMEVLVNFSIAEPPKITAKVVDADSTLGDAQIVWSVFPSSSVEWLGYDGNLISQGIPLAYYPLQSASIPGQSVTLGVASSSQEPVWDNFKIDWSDERDGLLSIDSAKMLSGDTAYAVDIAFGKGKTTIDPYIVASGDESIKTASYQRHTFWYGGYYWVFYPLSNGIGYKISSDGITWGSAVWTVPNGTALNPACGFDVAMRGGKVAVSWIDAALQHVFLQKGMILMGNRIVWDTRISVTSVSTPIGDPISVAIGTDCGYWIAAHTSNGHRGAIVTVYRSIDGVDFSQFWSFDDPGTHAYDLVLPLWNGNVALVEAEGTHTVCWRYFNSTSGTWTPSPQDPPWFMDILLILGDQTNVYSAVASLDGTIYLAYLASTGTFNLAVLRTDGSAGTSTVLAQSVMYPSICLDTDGILHVFYESSSASIGHLESWTPLAGGSVSWVAQATIPSCGSTIKGITSAPTPVRFLALTWMEGSNVVFASAPLPFGTSGATSNPWNQDGLSPYGTYFSTASDYVAPGSGMLTLRDTDLSIPSRGGLDLGVSRLYVQPRYFNSSGIPWSGYSDPYSYAGGPTDHSMFPACSLGQGWGLDLPWLDDVYVGLPGGQRYVISFGDYGNASEFENHDGTPFVLREISPGTKYDLILSSGMAYVFNTYSMQTLSYELTMISDGRGTSPLNLLNPTGSWINLYYGGRGHHSMQVLTGLADMDVLYGRNITLNYDWNGLLRSVARPDGGRTTFNYTNTTNDSRLLLKNVTDPMNRVTSYEYNSSADYCLASITFPTKAKISYSYVRDTSVGTEVRSWLVSKVVLRNDAGALVRQTNYCYVTVSGLVTFVRVTQINETGTVQGYTEYVFQPRMNCAIQTVRDSAGVQLSKVVTFYDSSGQPIRTDTYKGSSQALSYSEYSSYDDWGNVIFSRDALGHESYSSYANTETQNSYQGGDLLTRTTAGQIFCDGFDDWSSSRWTLATQGGGSISLDGAVDPPNAPALKVVKGTTGNGYTTAYHDIASQTSDFVIDLSYMTNSANRSAVLCGRSIASPYISINVSSSGGNFYYWTGSAWSTQSIGTCSLNTWYSFRILVHPSSNTYDIYINGTLARGAATLTASGTIYRILFQAGNGTAGAATIWVDSVRVYKGLTVTINGASDYTAELYDSTGQLVNKSKSGTLTVPTGNLSFPSGWIKLLRVGNYSFSEPTLDVWGGDVYSLSKGMYSSSLSNVQTGFGAYQGSAADDGWPSGSTTYGSGKWVNDVNCSVSGSLYYESPYQSGVSYQGFNSTTRTPQMYINGTDMLVQYVWLTDGKLPQEIMVQYYDGLCGDWHRAYWGGNYSTGADLITSLPGELQPLVCFRVGDIPQATGKWLQLVVKVSNLSFAGKLNTRPISGVVTGLYGGTARWDLSSVSYYQIAVYFVSGIRPGYTVELDFDNGKKASAISTQVLRVLLDGYAAGVNIYPASGSFRILNGSALVYQSPWFGEIYNYDQYSYSAPTFYPNEVKKDTHARPVGSLQFQDYAKTVPQEIYWKYDTDGNNVETKARLDTRWIVSRAGYDSYGHLIWSSDPTGRGTIAEYSAADDWTYINATSPGVLTGDGFETDTSWTPSVSGGGGSLAWMTAQYSTAQSHSPTRLIQLNFSNASSDGTDFGRMTMYKDYLIKNVTYLSLWMNVGAYSHNGTPYDSMDSGVRMRLYDSSGKNYVNYTYWLACWSQGANDKALPPDQYNSYTKKVSNCPAQGTWLNPIMQPSRDWTIDWSRCAKIRMELYVNASGAIGDLFKVYYDDLACLSSYGRTTYAYDTKNKFTSNGYLLSSTDPLARKTNWSYDLLGRVVWTQYTDGAHTRTVYDDKANTATTFDESNHKKIYYYDSIGRKVKTERYAGSPTNYSWERNIYNWQDQVYSYRDAGGHVTTTIYDCLGRVTKVTYPDLNYTVVTYDDISNIVTYESYNRSNGLVTHRLVKLYDNLGRLNKTTEYASSSTSYDTLMTYDAAGNLRTVRDAKGQVTRMAYDALNKLAKNTYPDGLTDNVSYDDAGRIICEKDREGNCSFTTYDPAGRVLRVACTSDIIIYAYDVAGQKVRAQNSNLGVISYGYNTRGMMTSLTEAISGSNTYSLSFFYDSENRLMSVTYPDATLNYFYDALDRVSDVKKGTTELLNFTYNKDDSVASEKTYKSDGTTVFTSTTYAYSNRDWPTAIWMRSGGAVKLMLLYSYDDVGNVKKLVINQTASASNAKTEVYTYDWLDRLKSAVGGSLPSGLTYVYDAVGNALTFAGKACTYGAYNRLTSDGTWSYAYDGNGNLARKTSSDGKTVYQYLFNSLDQLTSAIKWTKSGQTWSSMTLGTYRYDANGMRANTTEGTTRTDYVYVGHDPWYERSKSGTTQTTTDYIYVNGGLKAKIVAGGSSPGTYFYITDALGSVRQVWKQGATTAAFSVATYKPFGTPVSVTGTEKIGYAGELLDSAAGTSPGLYYIGARWMDPELGRFISLDPKSGSLESPQTLNRYVYCANNPLRFTDPTGEIRRTSALGGGYSASTTSSLSYTIDPNPNSGTTTPHSRSYGLAHHHLGYYSYSSGTHPVFAVTTWSNAADWGSSNTNLECQVSTQSFACASSGYYSTTFMWSSTWNGGYFCLNPPSGFFGVPVGVSGASFSVEFTGRVYDNTWDRWVPGSECSKIIKGGSPWYASDTYLKWDNKGSPSPDYGYNCRVNVNLMQGHVYTFYSSVIVHTSAWAYGECMAQSTVTFSGEFCGVICEKS
jgi:RHS repeat-associated protein